jgi:hypothetical protein
MTSRGRSANNFGILTLAAVLVVAAACDTDYSNRPHLATFASPLAVTPFIATSIVPQRIGLTPVFGIRCVAFPSLTTRFDLVIDLAGGSDLFMQQVGFTLLDGTHRGASPLLISAFDLSARFGSTLIRSGSRRSFTFDPQFGCGSFVPQFLVVDVVLLDLLGSDHSTKVVVPVR